MFKQYFLKTDIVFQYSIVNLNKTRIYGIHLCLTSQINCFKIYFIFKNNKKKLNKKVFK